MVRELGASLGVGLLVVWIVALATHQPAWITWLDFVAGVAMLANAFVPSIAEMALAASLGVGLFALSVISLSMGGVSAWLTWWNFGFGCAYVAFAIPAGQGAVERIAGPLGAFRHERPHHRPV